MGTYGFFPNKSFDFVKNECSQDPSCAFVIDICGRGQAFVLCRKKGGMTDSKCGSTLYEKGIDVNITRMIAAMV